MPEFIAATGERIVWSVRETVIASIDASIPGHPRYGEPAPAGFRGGHLILRWETDAKPLKVAIPPGAIAQIEAARIAAREAAGMAAAARPSGSHDPYDPTTEGHYHLSDDDPWGRS